MKYDGKQLEGLVSFVEETLVPKGFTVDTNTKILNDEGVQVAEFDVEVRGKVGTTEIAWLIECRDRPSQGAAPGSWIEQLVGRRRRFGFNKVTAVSTTGFSSGAREFASESGIELREVSKLAKEHFENWLLIKELTAVKRHIILHGAIVLTDRSESPEKIEDLKKILQKSTGDTPLLHSTLSGNISPLKDALLGAVNEEGTLFEDVEKNGESKFINLHVKYEGNVDHFFIKTAHGSVKISEIKFNGELKIVTDRIPLIETSEYRMKDGDQLISQIAVFDSQNMHGHEVSLEMHKLTDTGETHLLLRKK